MDNDVLAFSIVVMLIAGFVIGVVSLANAREAELTAQCKADLAARGFSFVKLGYHYGGYECWGMKSNGDPVRIW